MARETLAVLRSMLEATEAREADLRANLREAKERIAELKEERDRWRNSVDHLATQRAQLEGYKQRCQEQDRLKLMAAGVPLEEDTRPATAGVAVDPDVFRRQVYNR